MAAVAVWYMFFAPQIAFIAISFIIAALSIWEFRRALGMTRIIFSPTLIYLNSVLNLAAFIIYSLELARWSLFILGVNLISILFFSAFKWKVEKGLVFWYLLPQLWIISPILLIITLRFKIVGDAGSHLIFLVLLIAIFNDIFAYFGGKRFGKHLLAPAISPKKTIEGSLFDLAGGFVAGFGLIYFYPFYQYKITAYWVFALIIVCLTFASQAGDLVESRFKRYCQIKDSSNLIPGHGGLLDRIDAYLFAIPVFVCILYLLGIPAK